MKRIIIAITSVLFLGLGLYGQNYTDHIVSEVLLNNTSLSALRKANEAQKIGNKRGLGLDSPELEFNYLWGNPTVIGNRTDISVSQTFDFPTTYLYKNQISSLKNEQLDYEYIKHLKEVELETTLVLTDLIYANAMTSALSKRMMHAKEIARLYQRKLELGESNIFPR